MKLNILNCHSTALKYLICFVLAQQDAFPKDDHINCLVNKSSLNKPQTSKWRHSSVYLLWQTSSHQLIVVHSLILCPTHLIHYSWTIATDVCYHQHFHHQTTWIIKINSWDWREEATAACTSQHTRHYWGGGLHLPVAGCLYFRLWNQLLIQSCCFYQLNPLNMYILCIIQLYQCRTNVTSYHCISDHGMGLIYITYFSISVMLVG